MYVDMYVVCMYMYICICAYIRMYIRMYVYVCLCMYLYILSDKVHTHQL